MERRDFLKTLGIAIASSAVPFTQTASAFKWSKSDIDAMVEAGGFKMSDYGVQCLLDSGFRGRKLNAELWLTEKGEPAVFMAKAEDVKFGEYTQVDFTGCALIDGAAWLNDNTVMSSFEFPGGPKGVVNGDTFNLFLPALDELLNVK